MAKVKKEDQVVVISGADKGKTGRVIEVIKNKAGQAEKLLVEGINFHVKHNKLQQNQGGRQGTTGGIETFEAPIHVSNVQVVDKVSGKGTRVGFKQVDGKNVRVSKRSGKEL